MTLARIERVLVALGAVGLVDIVDQAFVERPGIHPAFPVVDDRVAEAIGLGLLVGNAGLDPGILGRLLRRFRGRDEEGIDRGIQCLGGDQRIFVFGMAEFGIMLDHGGGSVAASAAVASSDTPARNANAVDRIKVPDMNSPSPFWNDGGSSRKNIPVSNSIVYNESKLPKP